MKKNSLKSSSTVSSKSSFGNAKNTSNASFNRFNSANTSLSGGSAFGKATSFKRSVSVGAGYSFACDKKPISYSNGWKASKHNYEKIATTGTKSIPDCWKGQAAKYEKNFNCGSKYSTDSISCKPKFEKPTNTDFKRVAKNSFATPTPNYKNSLSVGSQFSAESCKPSSVSKFEKCPKGSSSSMFESLLPSKNTINKTTQKSTPVSNYYSPNKSSSEKSGGVNSYNKGVTEKSNSGFLSSSSSLSSGKAKNINSSQFETNKNNKTDKVCNAGFYTSSGNEYSSKPKNVFLNDSDNYSKKESKISRDSAEDAVKRSNVSGKPSQNDHHFYNNLSKLFHLKGSSHGQHELKTSHFISPSLPESKPTSLHGSPSVNLECSNPKRNLDFNSPESMLKGTSTTIKDYNLKEDFKKVSFSGNSLNSKPDMAPTGSCAKVTVFGSAVSDASNHYHDAYGFNINDNPLLPSPDNHAHKLNHGKSFNKNIFGLLFVKHSGDKKGKNRTDSFQQVSATSMGLNPGNTSLSHQLITGKVKGNGDCKTREDLKQNVPKICITEAQKLSSCGSDCGSKPLKSNQVLKVNKSGSVIETQSLIHANQDHHRIFHNEEKTKVIAELLKSYCIQQRKEVCLDNGLKPVQKPPLGSNNQHKVSIGIDRNDVDCMSIAHPVENHVFATSSINAPVTSVNQRPKIQSANTATSSNNLLLPSTSNNPSFKNSCKESIQSATNINCTSFNQFGTTSQPNLISVENHKTFKTETPSEIDLHNTNYNKSAISATENGYFVVLPESFNSQCKGVRKKVSTNVETPVTPSSSTCNAHEIKNGHLQLFKSGNILSSFSNLTHAISTGPLKKSSKEQQRNAPKRKLGEAAASMSGSINDNLALTASGNTHIGIIPSLDHGNHHASNFQNSQSTKNINKCNKQKQSPFVEINRDHTFPFMVNSRGHHVPISTHARDAILSALMFSTINTNRKKAGPKQQRCANRLGNQQFGGNQNSMGLSAIGLALPRASSQPNSFETQWDKSDDSDDPLPETPPFMIPCSHSANDLGHEDYFNGRLLESHTVDDFRNSYEKVTKVITHGRELLATGNYLHACIEFEVGLKLMDCILESKIDESDMSPLDKAICKSVQEVIKVDRKSALEGYSDAQAGYVAPRLEPSQQLPDGAPTAPPSYTDVLREDLEKNFFSCGNRCMNVNQQIAREEPSLGVDVPSAPSEDLVENLPSSPPSYELHESVSQSKIDGASCQGFISNPKQREPVEATVTHLPPSSPFNIISSESENQRTSSCDKIIEKEQSSEKQACDNCALNEKGSVNSFNIENNQNVLEIKNNNLEVTQKNGSVTCQQSTGDVLTSSLIVATTAGKKCESRFMVCPGNLNTEKPESINLQTIRESCKTPGCASLTRDEENLSKDLCSKPEGLKECNISNVSGSITKTLSTADVKQLNEKANQPTLILNNENKEENLKKESSVNSPLNDSSGSLTRKSLNVSGYVSSDAKTLAENHPTNEKLLSSAPPPPQGQLPPLPSIVPSSKYLAFPPDVEVLKQNNLKPNNNDQKSELTKALTDTEIENIYVSFKDYHNRIKVCNDPVLGDKLDEFTITKTSNSKNIKIVKNNTSVKEENNINQELKCEDKLVRPGNEIDPYLNGPKQILSDRTIVLDPFLFEDPFTDGCFNCSLEEEDEPFYYDDEICNFSLQENSKNDFETIFAPICNLDCFDDKLPLVSGFTKEEFTVIQNNTTPMEVKRKEFSRISYPCNNNLEVYQSQDKFPATTDSVTSKSSSVESFYITTSDTNRCITPKLIINMLYETNNICINKEGSHNETIASIDLQASECLNGTQSLIHPEKSLKSAANDKFLAWEKKNRQIAENVVDKSLSGLRNSREAVNQEELPTWNSEHKKDTTPIYQNVNPEITEFEQIYQEIYEMPSTRTVDEIQSPESNIGNSFPTSTVLGVKPVAGQLNKGSSPKSFNSRLEMNIKKGLNSFPFLTFIYNKKTKQSSDEGRLIGQSSFFIDVENSKEGGSRITLMELKDVRVYFMDSTQNISSPSINQTIAICQKKEKTHCEGSVRLEIGKKFRFQYLNVTSTNVLKTIKKVYIIEENSDSYIAIQLPPETKFSIIDQFEGIMKKNSNYETETEVLAKHRQEYRKVMNKMEGFIKEKSPSFYLQAHDLSRRSTRAAKNAAASISKGIMNFQSSKLAIRDTPSTSPLTLKLNGQMEILQIKGRLLEEAQWKNLIVFI